MTVSDKRGVGAGRTVIYQYSLFIPKGVNLKQNSNPTVYLGQLNSTANNHYSSPIMVVWNDYSGIEFQTYNDFNWQVSNTTRINNILPVSGQKGKWIDIQYEVTVDSGKRGRLLISGNGKSVFQRLGHPTIKSGGKVSLKMGIYNYRVSVMNEPRSNQIVFFDKISRKLIN